jgi:hypothetical protein
MLLSQSALQAVLHEIIGKGGIAGERPGEAAQMGHLDDDFAAKVHGEAYHQYEERDGNIPHCRW